MSQGSGVSGSLTLALLYLFAYLLGSVPFAVIFGRMKGVDVMKMGSGNPGMTNVWRNLGPAWGVSCFLLDVAKGFVPTLLATLFVQHDFGIFDRQVIWFSVGLAAVVGHSASIFLKFKGGKGVSTALGIVLGAAPIVGLCCFTVFLIVWFLSGYVSISSVVAVASVIVWNFVVPHQSRQMYPVYVAITIFVAYRHRKNFQRLRQGTEPKSRLRLRRAS